MKHMVGLLLVGVLSIQSVYNAVAGEDDKFEAQIKTARKYFQLIVDAKYDEFMKVSDANVRKGLPADKLKEAWMGISSAFGSYEGEISASAMPVNDMISVELLSKFSSGRLSVRVTLDKDLKVAGLLFVPASKPRDYDVPSYVDESKFREEEITVTHESYSLPGTLTIPKGKGPFPAVVLVHGSGPHDRDETLLGNKPFKDIAWGLASRGIAVLRYEKRTLKYGSTLDPTKIGIDEEITDDALAAARMLMKHKDVDSLGVFVAGHSLGATAAPYIGRKERKLAGIIMFAAAARDIFELVEEQIIYIANLDGTVSEAERKQIDTVTKEVKALRDWTWKPGDTLMGAPTEYWARLKKMAPLVNAKKLTMPMLVLQGGRDYQVSPENDFGKWKEELAGRDNVTFKLFKPMDHLFRKGKGPSTPQDYQRVEAVDETVIKYVADWIHKVCK